jgi:hypothetical protein
MVGRIAPAGALFDIGPCIDGCSTVWYLELERPAIVAGARIGELVKVPSAFIRLVTGTSPCGTLAMREICHASMSSQGQLPHVDNWSSIASKRQKGRNWRCLARIM